MKRLAIILIAGAWYVNHASAQGTGGFFNQQSSKEKLMLTQIAELDIYGNTLKTGYNITEKGLNTAGELKNGTFNLHNVYYTSLQQVSPAVASNPKGKGITDMQQKIVSLFTTEIN